MAPRAPRRSFGPLLAILFAGGAIYATIANQRKERPPAPSVTKSNTLTAAASISSAQPPVRDCQDADIPCISERNKEIVERNKYVMDGGEGQMLPLSMIPIPPVQTFEVAKIPKAAYRASPRTPQTAIRSSPAAVDATEKQTKPAPATGDMQPRRRRNAIAPFTMLTESGQNYLIKLINADNAGDQIWIFVRGGESYSTKVPVGSYYFRAASGNEWYGREDLFGPSTHFFRLRPKNGASGDAQQTLQFRKERNRIFGMTISLKGVANGNIEQEAMTRLEFDAN
ncbi:hypothetical protein ACVW1C_003324 [Bradyrhizobium sp. USDA 4011]